MTAARLAGLTLGELRSTRETRDLDTPARAATVSSVGRRPVGGAEPAGPVPGVATSAPPSSGRRWMPLERSNTTSARPGPTWPEPGPTGADLGRAGPGRPGRPA